MSIAGHILGSIVSIAAMLSIFVGLIAGLQMEHRPRKDDREVV